VKPAPDRKTLSILLAALELEQKDLAEMMGYDKNYVTNAFNGHAVARPAFRRAFGETIGSLILGTYQPATAERYPAAPLLSVIKKRAADAPCKRDFYRDLGLNGSLDNPETFDAIFVDRVCCSLGIHPTSIYGHDYELEA
jgi:hypothetical protein